MGPLPHFEIIFEIFQAGMNYFFLGGGGTLHHIFLNESFNYGQIRLHPQFQCPRSFGSDLKVTMWGGGWNKPIIIITLHSVELG